MFEGLWFPEPPERVLFNIFDESIDGVQNPLVLFLPLKVIFPSFFGPSRDHMAADFALLGSIGSCRVNLPASAFLMEPKSRVALLGFLRR